DGQEQEQRRIPGFDERRREIRTATRNTRRDLVFLMPFCGLWPSFRSWSDLPKSRRRYAGSTPYGRWSLLRLRPSLEAARYRACASRGLALRALRASVYSAAAPSLLSEAPTAL